MTDVAIDLDRLAATAGDARTLRDDFAGAERFAEDIGGLTGHDGLAAKVEEFGHEWDVAREDLGEALGRVADFMQAIHDTFCDLDDTMAHGISGP
ncbi:hypothetical protein KUV85_08585 [Nocardioides panacisoli]|uniref:hypothetical protein n=1 Tax=Nocardioides panacisoli TaxID=627624 RepID=UPI001C62EF85|nr:hypothetical protein [Nocardioides panacisoli]QYJ05719.1 hypothetical protein KUV85_08585 [Nocardioides panacisoli]